MNHPWRLLASLLLLSAFASPATRADPTDLDSRLVITNGVIAGQSENGQPERATLHNLVDVIKRRFPDTNITLIGVGDVTVDNLDLEWKTTTIDGRQHLPPLKGILLALRVASGDKFRVADVDDEKNWVLEAPMAEQPSDDRHIQIFNVGNYVANQNRREELTRQLRDMEAHYGDLREKFGDKSSEAADFKVEVRRTEEQLKMATRTTEQQQQRLDEIYRVATETLEKFHPGATAPEFSFHPGSNLLVVIGSGEAVDVTSKVIAAIIPGN